MGTINPVNKSLCLEKLCETNYQKLFRLIPDLLSIEENAVGYAAGKPDLYMDVVDKTPYTLTLQLTHCFSQKPDEFFEPAVKIRIYLDARLAEVVRDHTKSDVSRTINRLKKIAEIMDYKWSLNYFLEKWLDHCLHNDYHFEESGQSVAMAD